MLLVCRWLPPSCKAVGLFRWLEGRVTCCLGCCWKKGPSCFQFDRIVVLLINFWFIKVLAVQVSPQRPPLPDHAYHSFISGQSSEAT